MSRIANKPISVPAGVDVNINGNAVAVKGSKGSLGWDVHPDVVVELDGGEIRCSAKVDDKKVVALTGTTRSLLNNMIIGVSKGFEKKLQLVGVGYRAQMKGNSLSLSLGLSHPADYPVPEGVQIETPSQTEIVVKGIDKQLIGQVAAEIRAYRPPEPYKGKGVRYADEHIVRKEAKKK
ncbi:MAG: 50S ribosomal protein L6 [Gammaproteobacteria bacterium]|nr:MAG: 50S ribosomal protein L6 [Gammaproteobacteria bacterium]